MYKKFGKHFVCYKNNVLISSKKLSDIPSRPSQSIVKVKSKKKKPNNILHCIKKSQFVIPKSSKIFRSQKFWHTEHTQYYTVCTTHSICPKTMIIQHLFNQFKSVFYCCSIVLRKKVRNFFSRKFGVSRLQWDVSATFHISLRSINVAQFSTANSKIIQVLKVIAKLIQIAQPTHTHTEC